MVRSGLGYMFCPCRYDPDLSATVGGIVMGPCVVGMENWYLSLGATQVVFSTLRHHEGGLLRG